MCQALCWALWSTVSHLIATTAMGGRCYYYARVTDEDTEAQRRRAPMRGYTVTRWWRQASRARAARASGVSAVRQPDSAGHCSLLPQSPHLSNEHNNSHVTGLSWGWNGIVCVQVLCQLSNASRNNSSHRTPLTTYLVALHAMLGKFGLVASRAVEVLPFREEASSPDHLLAVAAGETVFVPDDPLVLHVLISCGGEAVG